jgi:hypothetical protein
MSFPQNRRDMRQTPNSNGFIPRKPAQPAGTGAAGLRSQAFSCQLTQILKAFQSFRGMPPAGDPFIH